MILHRRRTLLLGAALAPWLSPASAAQEPTARVIASFSILADIARELAPPGVEVSSLVGIDADAHVYEPSPADGRARTTRVAAHGRTSPSAGSACASVRRAVSRSSGSVSR